MTPLPPPRMRGRTDWTTLAVAVVALVVAVLAALGLDVDGDDTAAPAGTVTAKVDGPDPGAKPDIAVKAPAGAVDVLERTEVGEHQGARDETPAGASVDELAAGERQQRRIRRTQPPLPTAGAAASVPGCVTRFVANQSSRNGIRPQLFVLHYTVSYNRPGWSDVNAIVAMFDRPSVSASSHFVIDAEGNCAYIVPLERKAWTQAGGNSIGVSVEVVAYGNETRYLDPAGYAKLGQVVRTVHARTGIPLRIGAVAGCGVGRAGIVDHFQGGTCWGGHHDIRPFPFSAEVSRILGASTSSTATASLTKPERRIVSRRCYHWRKRHGATPGSSVYNVNLRWSRHWRAEAGARKRLLTRLDHYSTHHRGSRRRAMARAERLDKSDRRALCS